MLGIVNFNHVYHAQRELAYVAGKMGVPFLTLLKECLRTPVCIEETEYVYRHIIKSYEGRKIAVHNKAMKRILLNSGVVSEDKISVVGQGRSEMLLRIRRRHARGDSQARKRIAYFLISETAGLPYFGDLYAPSGKTEVAAFTWADLAEIVWRYLIEYIETRSDVTLVVKGKPSGVYANNLPSRKGAVSFIHGNPDMSLYEEADVVVGLNTTALVESVAAGVPAISTQFGVDEQVMKPYLFDWYGCVDTVCNRCEFFDRLDKYLFDSAMPDVGLENREKLLSTYLGNGDGDAGKRIRNFLERNLSDLPENCE